MKKNKVLIILMILSVLGLLTSLYLLKNHYNAPLEGGFCDITSGVSCTLVNNSIYSELLGIPVALLGAVWFIILFLLSWKAMKKKMNKEKYLTYLLAWSIVGVLFAMYFVIAEMLLKSICPLCTLAHVIILIALIFSIILYKKNTSKTNKKR